MNKSDFEKKKKLAETEIARAAVKSYVNAFMSKKDFDYNLKDTYHGIILTVNANNNRKIEISITRKDYMQVIPHLISTVKSLMTTLDSIELTNVSVANVPGGAKWAEFVLDYETLCC